jgi:NDP-4-keto-2,6-dideoxyhexose 3-C-methyltransferase
MASLHKCRICSGEDLTEVINLGNQGLASCFPRESDKDPDVVPLVLVRCNNSKCSLVQLKHTVPNSDMYEQPYGYRSGINKTMTEHLQNFVRKIESIVDLKDGDSVLDIGSNDATFLKSYDNKTLKKFGIDPTGSQFKEYYTDDITLVPTYFKAGLVENKMKVVTSISMFYDLPDPVQFAKDVKSQLHTDGIWVMEQSYLPMMLKYNSFDTICHEHLEYYSLKQILYICELADLEVFDVDFNPCNGGSFRVFITHKNGSYIVNRDTIDGVMRDEFGLRLDADQPYIDFNKRCDEIRTKFINTLKQFPKDDVYLYGASTKGNTLLQHWGVDHTLIKGAAERNPRKYGCRTPITNIPIVSEAEMREANPKCLVVLPWHFKNEFIDREKEYINKGGTMIFPLPEFIIVRNNMVSAPISHGELIDKITILEIKLENIKDETALKNIENELNLLKKFETPSVKELKEQLKTVNKTIWDTEDELHRIEKTGVFDDNFIKFARQAYTTNDERARIKKDINKLLGSTILEEKSYDYA